MTPPNGKSFQICWRLEVVQCSSVYVVPRKWMATPTTASEINIYRTLTSSLRSYQSFSTSNPLNRLFLLEKLVKLTIFVQRYVDNCRWKFQDIPGYPDFPCMRELLKVEKFVIRQAQCEVYSDELADQPKNQQLPNYLLMYLQLWMPRTRLFYPVTIASPTAAFHWKFHHLDHEAVINELR